MERNIPNNENSKSKEEKADRLNKIRPLSSIFRQEAKPSLGVKEEDDDDEDDEDYPKSRSIKFTDLFL